MKIVHRELYVGKPPNRLIADESYYKVEGKERSIGKKDIVSAITAPIGFDPSIDTFFSKKGTKVTIIIDDPTLTEENVQTKYPEYFI